MAGLAPEQPQTADDGSPPQRYVFDDASSLIEGGDNRLWFEGTQEDGYGTAAPQSPLIPAARFDSIPPGEGPPPQALPSPAAHHVLPSPEAASLAAGSGVSPAAAGERMEPVSETEPYRPFNDILPPSKQPQRPAPPAMGGAKLPSAAAPPEPVLTVKRSPTPPDVRPPASTVVSFAPMPEEAREDALVTPMGGDGGHGDDGVAAVLGFPEITPTPPTTVFVDIAALTCVLHFEVVYRRFLRRWAQAVFFFCLVVLIAMLHTDIKASHHMTSFLSESLAKPYINGVPEHTLATADSPDKVWDWLETVWAPALFGGYDVDALSANSQAVMRTYNKVAMSPVLRTRRRAATSCGGVYLDTRLQGGTYCFRGTLEESFAANGRTYYPTDGLEGKPATRAGPDFYAVFRVNDASYNDGNTTRFNITDLTSAVTALRVLRADGWFTSENEFLEATVVTYNPYVDLVGNLRVVFDVSEGGGVTPLAGRSLLHITRLDWYTTARDKGRFILELVFMVATFLEAIFTYSHIRRAKRRGASVLAYFTANTWAWNWFEVIYVLVALAAFGLYIRLIVEQPSLPDLTPILDGRYSPFSPVFGASKTMNAVLITLTGIRVIRYMGFIPSWGHLSLTLAKVISPLLTFLVVIYVLCIGFACAGMYAFGSADPQFTTFGYALQTVLSFYTKDVDYFQLTRPETDVTRGVFPPIFFWALFIVMAFVVAGIVVGVAVVAHLKARDELKEWYAAKAASERWRWLAPRREWYWRIPGAIVFDTFPKYLLEVLGATGKRWIIPLMVEYPATSKLIAEVGGGRLRVYISVQSWFQRKLIGARGVAVVLPAEAIAPVTSRLQRGYIAKVHPGQAPYLTTEPLSGTSEIEFLVDGNMLRTKGGVDLGMAQDQTVILEFPRVINDRYEWGASEVLVCADTVSRIATYGGCFTHAPADWIVCSVGLPTTLETCPFLVTVPEVPLEDILQAVDHSGVELDDEEWRHSVTSLAQMFSRSVEYPAAHTLRDIRNPLDDEQHRSVPRMRPTPQLRPV